MAESKGIKAGLATKAGKATVAGAKVVEPKEVKGVDTDVIDAAEVTPTVRERMKSKDPKKSKEVASIAADIKKKKEELDELTKASYSIIMPRTEMVAYLKEITNNIEARGDRSKNMDVAISKINIAISLLSKATDL